jgi:hypothetical protein
MGEGPLQREIERRKGCDKRGQRAVSHVSIVGRGSSCCDAGGRRQDATHGARAASATVDQKLLEESWRICVQYLGIQSLGLLGDRELIMLASTSRSLKHMRSGELDSRCSVWNRCCVNETSSHTARILSAVAKHGKNTCVTYLAYCKIVTVNWFSS